jgi:hypothetical protein
MQAVVFALNTPEYFAIGWEDPKGPPSAPPAIPPIIINPFSYQTPSTAIDPHLPPPGPPWRRCPVAPAPANPARHARVFFVQAENGGVRGGPGLFR